MSDIYIYIFIYLIFIESIHPSINPSLPVCLWNIIADIFIYFYYDLFHLFLVTSISIGQPDGWILLKMFTFNWNCLKMHSCKHVTKSDKLIFFLEILVYMFSTLNKQKGVSNNFHSDILINFTKK